MEQPNPCSKGFVPPVAHEPKLHSGLTGIKHVVSAAFAVASPSSWLLCSQFHSFSRRLVHLQEPNFHLAYVELLEKMDKGAMQKHLAVTTYKYIKVLLKSDRIKTQVSHSSAGLSGVFQGTSQGCRKAAAEKHYRQAAVLTCYAISWHGLKCTKGAAARWTHQIAGGRQL